MILPPFYGASYNTAALQGYCKCGNKRWPWAPRLLPEMASEEDDNNETSFTNGKYFGYKMMTKYEIMQMRNPLS
jgi:hypothetical protein